MINPKTKLKIKKTRCLWCGITIIDLRGLAPSFCDECRPKVRREIDESKRRIRIYELNKLKEK